MKKVLIISYYWPPAGGPGSQRIVKFVKYLPQFGWQPYILTVQKGEFSYTDHSLEKDIPANVKVYRTKNLEPFFLYKSLTGRSKGESLPVGLIIHKKKNIIEKISLWIRANVFIPDARIGWIPFAVKKALQITKDEKIDLIFSSSPPHSLQLIGWYVTRKTNIPWVTDFRDRWTDIRYYQVLSRSSLAKKIDGYFEKQVLKNSNCVTSTSEGFNTDFREKIKSINQTFQFLPNGYDDEDFKNLQTLENKKFTILHTGSLIAQQNPIVFWRSLKGLLQKDEKIKKLLLVQLIGKTHESITKSVKELNLSDIVEFYDYVPHEKVLQEMQDASILFAVIPDLPNNKSIVLGKIYEYIGTGKPILIIGPQQSDAGKVISKFSNSLICNYMDEEGCMKFVELIFRNWIKSHDVPEIPQEARLQYSRKKICQSLTNIFNSLLK